ncbi:MAG: DUF6497 family protein [Paracoccaceae bacterium]
MTNHALKVSADDIAVPSGLNLTLQEVITDRPGQGLTYRFRFVAPEIAGLGGQLDYDIVEQDMAHLCRTFALSRIPQTGPKPNQIVISIADRATAFGTADPDVTQFFEAYSINGDDCEWEPF